MGITFPPPGLGPMAPEPGLNGLECPRTYGALGVSDTHGLLGHYLQQRAIENVRRNRGRDVWSIERKSPLGPMAPEPFVLELAEPWEQRYAWPHWPVGTLFFASVQISANGA